MSEGGIANRRSNRSNVMLKATLECESGPVEVVLRNLSQDGALIQGKHLPPEGARVLFHRQGLSAPGRIAWTHCACAGLSFDCPLYPKELLRHIPEPAQKADLPSIRRPGLVSKPLTAAEKSLIEQWASHKGAGAVA